MRILLVVFALVVMVSRAHAEAGVPHFDLGTSHDLGLPDASNGDVLDGGTQLDAGTSAPRAGCGCSAAQTDRSAFGHLTAMGVAVLLAARRARRRVPTSTTAP